MRISSSSSMLLAALAISASSPSLTGAAPTGAGTPDGGLTPSQSTRDTADSNSPVPVARHEESEEDVEIITARGADGDCNGAVRKILKPVIGIIDPLHLPIVPGLLGDLSDTLDKALGTCEKKAGTHSFQAADNSEDEKMVQLQSMVAQAVVDAMDGNAPAEGAPDESAPAPGSEPASSAAPDSTPAGPPNTPSMSSEAPGPSNVARQIFQRRSGVAAPSVSANSSETANPTSSSASRPEPTQTLERRQEEDSTSAIVSSSASATPSAATGDPEPFSTDSEPMPSSEPVMSPPIARADTPGPPAPPAGPPAPPAGAPSPPGGLPAPPVSAPVTVPVDVPAKLPVAAPVSAPVNAPVSGRMIRRHRAHPRGEKEAEVPAYDSDDSDYSECSSVGEDNDEAYTG